MPPSLFSPYPPRVGTQILLTDLHYRLKLCFYPTARSQWGCPDRAAPLTQSNSTVTGRPSWRVKNLGTPIFLSKTLHSQHTK